MLRTYIGTKIIQAEPMESPDSSIDEPAPGYKVVYEDGYESWSPREIFERCYREVTDAEKALM